MGWPKYVVAPAFGPTAPYQSIQSAIDAASSDGFGNEGPPAVVLVHPGSYTENVTLAQGINLVAFSPDGLVTEVAGTLTVSGVGGTCHVAGLRFDGDVSISGGNQSVLFTDMVVFGRVSVDGVGTNVTFEDSVIDQPNSGLNAVEATNTDATTFVAILRSTVRAANGLCFTGVVGLDTAVCNLQLVDTTFASPITVSAATLTGANDTIEGSTIFGGVNAVGSVSSFRNTTIESSGVPAVSLFSSAHVTFVDSTAGRVDGAGPCVSGTGGGNTFAYQAAMLGAGIFADANTGTRAITTAASTTKSSVTYAGGVSFLAADTADVVVANVTSISAVILMLTSQWGDGRLLWIKKGGNQLDILAQSPDTLDEGGSVILAAGDFHGLCLRADVVNQVWNVIAKY